MENNEGSSAIVVKEDKSKLKKIWDKVVDGYVQHEKFQLKMMPAAVKICTFIAPEADPILVPLGAFLSTGAGKRVLDIASGNYDALGAAAKGDFSQLSDRISVVFDFMKSSDGKDTLEAITEIAKESGGMHK